MKIGNEKALIMRLHLLQSIVLFHQNRRSEAQNTLVLAESELLLLKISDTSVTMLVDMGKCSRFPYIRIKYRVCFVFTNYFRMCRKSCSMKSKC